MRLVVFAWLLMAACAPDREPEPAVVVPTPPPAPPESLALRIPPGTEIWFIEGRTATDSGGVSCYERGLEIRDAAGRRRVPLLYTLEAPSRLDDSSVRARVFTRCRPGDTYRVSLATGRPTPIAP